MGGRCAGPRGRLTIEAWFETHFASARPRAVAALYRQFRDIDLAEEAFAEACAKAVPAWRKSGLPRDPLAWLLVTARRAGIDRIRKARRPLPAPEAEAHLPEAEEIARIDAKGLRDDVLRLLFICCHPALAREDQLALALRSVAGLSVAEIARAFLVKPRAMEQRLTRAKRSIAANPVPFEVPDIGARARRLRQVSLMVYVLFSEGWSASAGEVQIRAPLCVEAIRLARLLLELFPAVSEQMGLLALMLYQHARAAARLGEDGALIPLEAQDRALWDRASIREARLLLQKAARRGPPGPFCLQAMIAGVSAEAPSEAETDWAALNTLYAALYAEEPSPIVRLNQAVAVARVDGPAAGLEMLGELSEALAGYRWYHTVKAGLCEELGAHAGALDALRAALALAPTGPEAAAISEKIALCEKNCAEMSEPGGGPRP